jgi:hypothetical protein
VHTFMNVQIQGPVTSMMDDVDRKE